MEAFAAYGPAIIAISVLVLFGVTIGAMSAAHKFSQGVESGALPKPDYSNFSYRFSRTYQNLVENIGFFGAALFGAILMGAAVYWVNLLAVLYVVLRLIVASVHMLGLGKANLGLRTMIFTLAVICNAGLALLAISHALAG